MKINVEMQLKHKILVVSLNGELDISSSDELRYKIDRALDEKPVKHLVLDLSRVSFIDSSGLGVILGRYKRVDRNGGKIVIVGLQPQVRRVMQLSGLLKLMEEVDIEEDALGILEEVTG